MRWFAMFAESAFRGCCSLFDIIIPDSVTSIGNEAFLFCNSLHSHVLPDGVRIQLASAKLRPILRTAQYGL